MGLLEFQPEFLRFSLASPRQLARQPPFGVYPVLAVLSENLAVDDDRPHAFGVGSGE